jgi:tellurite methyltransferase
MDERERWNAYYASRVNTYVIKTGEDGPHPFLRDHLALLPRGRALELAMGEGHNAIFLARQGFSVTGINISAVAVARSLQLSQEMGVAINAHCMDLRTTILPVNAYDVVTCFYYLQISAKKPVPSNHERTEARWYRSVRDLHRPASAVWPPEKP